MTTIQIEIPNKLRPVFSGEADIRGAYGGRGSAKTRTFAKMTAVKAYIWARAGLEGVILCGRQYMNSLDESSLEEIKAAIRSEPWLNDYFDIGEKYVRTICGRIRYVFSGLDRNIDSVKSKARILLCWVDEAEPVSELAWMTLIPTLREEVSELWVTWNPKDKQSATHKRFRVSTDPRMKVVEMNYQDNPWFPDVLNRTRLKDKKERPTDYAHVWEGDFQSVAEGALWSRKTLDASFVEDLPEFTRIVVAIDPATTSKEESAETGIVVCGIGFDGISYVIDDVSGRYSPSEWARKAIQVYHNYEADRIIAEVNQGGDMVKHTLETVESNIPITMVRASRGKQARAEPVAALYEEGKVKHTAGLERLEDQLTSWEPLSGAASPDRLDALVWGITDLMLQMKNEVVKANVSDIEISGIEIPDHWPKCYAVNITSDKITILWAGWNLATGQLVVYADYQKTNPEPALVADVVKARGDWMSGLHCVDKLEIKTEIRPYKSKGMKLKPVVNDYEGGIENLKSLISQDQIKVCSTAINSLDNLRNLRREETGKLDLDKSPYVKCLSALVLRGRNSAKIKPSGNNMNSAPARNASKIGGY